MFPGKKRINLSPPRSVSLQFCRTLAVIRGKKLVHFTGPFAVVTLVSTVSLPASAFRSGGGGAEVSEPMAFRMHSP